MKMQQKIAVYFLAALIFFIGAGMPMFSAFEVAPIPKENTKVRYIEPLPAAPLILFQQKPASLVTSGWESSLKIPGFLYFNLNLHLENPELTKVGQIFVVDLDSFYPCKSLLIFPFHDFI
jgi:hypothetical protein